MAGKIELKAPLDGVLSIEPEDTASNFTVTIPAVTSTLVNEASDIEAQVKTATNATGDAPIYACRAWVNFDGTGTVAIRASGNVSSITDNGTGDYTINFTTAMPDADYAVLPSPIGNDATTANHTMTVRGDAQGGPPTLKTTTQVRVLAQNSGGSNFDTEAYVAIFR